MKVLIVGDFVPQNRCLTAIAKGDYLSQFEDVVGIVQSADISIVNLESPIVEGNQKPIDKTGPNLCCPKETAECIKNIGFDCVTLANNHFYDYGDAGVESTLRRCNEVGLIPIGGGHNIDEASSTVYLERDNSSIAIVNVCEREWSIASKKHGGSAPLYTIGLYYRIQEAKRKADYIIVIVHGGIEMYQLPTPSMQDKYRFFVDAGADCVINHHQHCFSGYEIYHGKPIVYGLGNFCFDRLKSDSDKWSQGYMAELTFVSSGISVRIIPYIQFGSAPKVSVRESTDSVFKDSLHELNNIISNRTLLEDAFNRFCDEATERRLLALEPFRNKVICYLQRYGMIPRLVKREGRKSMLMRLRCDSNRETLTKVLERYFKLD